MVMRWLLDEASNRLYARLAADRYDPAILGLRMGWGDADQHHAIVLVLRESQRRAQGAGQDEFVLHPVVAGEKKNRGVPILAQDMNGGEEQSGCRAAVRGLNEDVPGKQLP